MALVRPRLNDFHGLAFTQEEADFAIPFLDDDIPLYVDPFLLWKSPSMQDQSLHTALVSSFNHFGYHYDMVQAYVQQKELTQADCKNDPLFRPIAVTSAKRKLEEIKKLPSGKSDNADKRYEECVCQLLASLFYPQLDFAAEQSRMDSGALIRDLIFYNNRSFDFLKDIFDIFGCRQLVFELKNVREVDTILTGEFKPFKDFTLFDESALPSNSDAVMILSQYLDCLEAWRGAHIYNESIYWYWKLDDKQAIKTQPPTRFRKA